MLTGSLSPIFPILIHFIIKTIPLAKLVRGTAMSSPYLLNQDYRKNVTVKCLLQKAKD